MPALGRFTSFDPVEGGSANDYGYANADPVNGLDLDGRGGVSARPSANGCSFSPDRPAGYGHDDCYAKFHDYSKRWKTRCDSRFKKNMNRVCSRRRARG